jgi:hypothetical protein
MTTPQQQPPLPAAAALGRLIGTEDERETDSDGTPVGRADAREDAKRTGADPDEV